MHYQTNMGEVTPSDLSLSKKIIAMLRLQSTSVQGAVPCGLEEIMNAGSFSLLFDQFFDDYKYTFVCVYMCIHMYVRAHLCELIYWAVDGLAYNPQSISPPRPVLHS